MRDEARTPIRDTSSRSGNRRLMFNARPQVLPRVLFDVELPSIFGIGNRCQLIQLLHSYVYFRNALRTNFGLPKFTASMQYGI